MTVARRLTVTEMEHVDVTRARQDEGGDRIVVSLQEDDIHLTTEVDLSLDVAEALQYALEQALR